MCGILATIRLRIFVAKEIMHKSLPISKSGYTFVRCRHLITEVTGHRSLAVHNYKCVSDAKREKVNDVIQGTSSDIARRVVAVTTTPSSIESSDGKVSLTINLN